MDEDIKISSGPRRGASKTDHMRYFEILGSSRFSLGRIRQICGRSRLLHGAIISGEMTASAKERDQQIKPFYLFSVRRECLFSSILYVII